MPDRPLLILILALSALATLTALGQHPPAVPLPERVKPLWDLDNAYRQTTPTREKICINGLWHWQPAPNKSPQPPTNNWGYFKVPGPWPGITDYMQKDSQTVHPHRAWKNQPLANLSAAWYERTISIPQNWAGRRVALSIDYLNSYAAVFINGTKRGEIHFPAGQLDLTPHLTPGATNLLTLLVVAMPLKAALLSYTDSNAARELKGKVERRGLCGDLFLLSAPAGPRITDLAVTTSVRKSQLACDLSLQDLKDSDYSFKGTITRNGRAIRELNATPANNAPRFTFTHPWKPDALWDIHTPANQFEISVSLLDKNGHVLDTSFPVPFGFREFWIDGRDFYLNGSRIFLSAVPLDNAQVGAALATYHAARETLERLKTIGINFVYTHNYGCEPGSHLSFEEILRAADDVGMLVALSQPHFSHYDWKSPNADRTNGYARHAEFYTRVARNHPSVVAYAMSHNATGYEEDMNPDMIDGLHDPRDQWSRRNAGLAMRAEAIVKRFDPSRIVYHHASGNLGSMHLMNFYPNFVPIQELSDWFGHWSTNGVKPAFMCEYGAPFTWDWTMYRGWYKGQREWGSAQVPWEYCIAEWNAQFLGDRAFQISKAEAANLRWEAKQFGAGKVWHRWDYPYPVGSPAFDEQYPVFAAYLTDNWRAFRTWGVSGISPWEHEHFWKLRDGIDKRRRDLNVDWENLQRPGFSPDYIDKTYERWDLAFERNDWIPTEAARALLRNNRPLLAYIGGKPGAFTSRDHIFTPGETVEKQLILINNSRETVTCDSEWSLKSPESITGRKEISLKPGEQVRVPLRFTLPPSPRNYELNANFRFSNGESQTDSFAIHVLAGTRAVKMTDRIAVFDTKGETSALLKSLGVNFQSIDANADLSAFDIFIVGKAALTTNGVAPNISRVRDGLKVIIFEQSADVLERRFGFRVAEYGLRQVFPRVPDHPLLANLSVEHWRDWRGEATILPSRLNYTLRPRYGPTVNWCDIPVPRLWRCGNRGNVASVLIEKPARGDFLPILDGGYSLQYSPLMEYREGRGMILFCQMDVTGRTESEPVAEALTRNVLDCVAAWKPGPARTAVYAGDPVGKRHLESAGFVLGAYDGNLKPDQVLVVGPDARLTQTTTSNILGIALDRQTAVALGLAVTNREHISSFFESRGMHSLLSGIAPADLHNRDPREIPLITSGAEVIGDGVLATGASSAFCQIAPWQFAATNQSNLKRTYRRASFVLTRLLTNFGVPCATPILARFGMPVEANEKRWLDGLYLDQPEEWDDPYRFFRW